MGMALIMADNLPELRPKPADTEKITINLGYVDLGHVDLMVQEGFYSNRTDFIRTAIRNQLERHAEVVKQWTRRHRLGGGAGKPACEPSRQGCARRPDAVSRHAAFDPNDSHSPELVCAPA